MHNHLAKFYFSYHNNILNLGAAHRYFYILFNSTFRRGAAPTFIQLLYNQQQTNQKLNFSNILQIHKLIT